MTHESCTCDRVRLTLDASTVLLAKKTNMKKTKRRRLGSASGLYQMEQAMKVWITKYALTRGILVKDAEFSGGPTNMITIGALEHYHYSDWHRSESAALAHAEKMRTTKIASLKKQIAKLEKLEFNASKP